MLEELKKHKSLKLMFSDSDTGKKKKYDQKKNQENFMKQKDKQNDNKEQNADELDVSEIIVTRE